MGKGMWISMAVLFSCSKVFSQADSASVKNSDSAYHALGQENEIRTPDGPSHLYNWKKGIDRPVTYVGTAWSLYAFTKIYSKKPSSVDEIQNLDRSKISAINRSGLDVYHPSAVTASNMLFIASVPLPLLLLTDKNIRNDLGRVASIYAESFAITGLLYTGSVYFVNKYRPLAYNPNVPIETRTRGGAKNSFFAGHVALVGTSTFFLAKVYSDYNPHSGLNWVLYTGAVAATGATAYLRYQGGQHFITDLILGEAVGIFSGILVPSFHKNKDYKNSRLSIVPIIGPSNGAAFVYRLQK